MVRLCFLGFYERDNIRYLPEAVRDASRHCRGHPKLRMYADKVIIHHVKRHGIGVVFDLLRKTVSQPSEAAHVHPHREIAALDVGRRYVREIGRTFDPFLLCTKACRRAVS